MGILSSIFMSKSEKEKLEKVNRRRITRGVERVIENLEDKAGRLNKECSTLWDKARQQLLSGQKNEAAATLRFYKAKSVMSRRVDHQLAMTRYRYDAIVGAADMQQVMGALQDLAANTNVDVDMLEETMETVDEATGDNNEVCKIIDRAFQRDMAKLDRDLEGAGEGEDDDLMKALEQEVASGAGAARGGTESSITSGQERLRNMLDGKK